MVGGFSHGLMTGNMKACGQMGNSMARGFSLPLKGRKKLGNGGKAKNWKASESVNFIISMFFEVDDLNLDLNAY